MNLYALVCTVFTPGPVIFWAATVLARSRDEAEEAALTDIRRTHPTQEGFRDHMVAVMLVPAWQTRHCRQTQDPK